MIPPDQCAITLDRRAAAWTRTHGAQAEREGWSLFQSNFGFEVERIDDPEDGSKPIFEGDYAAEAHVKTQVERGDACALEAVRIVAEQDCACHEHPEGCPGGDCDGCSDCRAGWARTVLSAPRECPSPDSADECALIRERSVAGFSDQIPDCRIHGAFPHTA